MVTVCRHSFSNSIYPHSFLLKVEKKGKERRHTWGKYVGERLGGNMGISMLFCLASFTLVHNTKRKHKYFFI